MNYRQAPKNCPHGRCCDLGCPQCAEQFEPRERLREEAQPTRDIYEDAT